jgi:acyl dehydratase
VFTQEDFDRFAVLSGDDNPIHVDAEYAATTWFERPVAHGMLLYSALCGLLSHTFPGAVQTEQHLMFPRPTFTGDEMTLRAEVTGVSGDRAEVAVEITNPAGDATCRGECVLIWEAS